MPLDKSTGKIWILERCRLYIINFCENGIAKGHHLPSVPMHRGKQTAKRKAESGRRSVKMPEKKSNQLVKTICDKKGVTSMKLAAR